MKARLAYKMFAAFFLVLLIVAGAFAFSRYLFTHQFREFMYQQDAAQLERLIPRFQEAYRQYGNWRRFRGQDSLWIQLEQKGPFGPKPMEGFRKPKESVPPPPGSPVPKAPEPPGRPPGQKPPPPGMPDIFLLDAQYQPVSGDAGSYDRDELRPVVVEGQTVGWLGINRRKGLPPGPADIFMKRHVFQLYALGGLVILLAACIAFWFSKHLLAPVKSIMHGTRELAGRNFGIRIPVKTGDELGVLAQRFNDLARTLEDYENLRRQWLSDISHELRTPMTVLRGEIEALCDGIHPPTQPHLASLQSEVLLLAKLIDDLHLLSEAESDSLHMEKQPLHPQDIVRNTVAHYRSRFAQRHIRVDLEMDTGHRVLVKGDAERLGQVFTNILENAYKYVDAPGTVRIAEHAEKDTWVVVFSDSGPGVPEEALPHLFERLYRVDASRSREHGGSGLGLSICRRIIHLHHGTIWARHASTGGLAIGIELPTASMTSSIPKDRTPGRKADPPTEV